MRWALLISLAVNLLLIGAAVGVGLGEARHRKERSVAAVSSTPTMRAVLAALPPERAAQVQAKVADAWRAAREEREQARDANLEVARLIGAETYDRAAVSAALSRMRAANSRVAGRFHEVVAEAMANMTAAERRTLLQALAARGADVRRDGAGELRRALQQMTVEQRRALLRELIDERRSELGGEGASPKAGGEGLAAEPWPRAQRLKALREERRKRRADEDAAPATPAPQN